MTRKTGIIAGIIAFMLVFIQKIPIYPPENISLVFYLFSNGNIEYYLWGYLIDGNQAKTSITASFPENLITIMLWLFIFFAGLSSIMASPTKATYKYSVKLYKINILLFLFLLGIYTTIGITINLVNLDEIIIAIFSTFGLGYYLILVCLILNVFALHALNKSYLEE